MSYCQWREIQRSGKDTTQLAEAASKQATALAGTNRPWLKIAHRIVEPLTFNVPVGAPPPARPAAAATMTLEDSIENVGQTVAVGENGWEEMVLIDAARTALTTALARQREWCDTTRQASASDGLVIFPRNPFTQPYHLQVMMPAIAQAAAKNGGKVGFLIVGCINYRLSSEPPTASTHQTRFMYWLGTSFPYRGFLPDIQPEGVADHLELFRIPGGFSAD